MSNNISGNDFGSDLPATEEPLLKRFSPFRIGVQISLLASLLVILTAFVFMQWLLQIANTSIVEHEKVDLQDETNLVAREVRDEYIRLKELAYDAVEAIREGQTDSEVLGALSQRPEVISVEVAETPRLLQEDADLGVPVRRTTAEGEIDWQIVVAIPYRVHNDIVSSLSRQTPRRLVVVGHLDALTQRDQSARHLTFVYDHADRLLSAPQRDSAAPRPRPAAIARSLNRLDELFSLPIKTLDDVRSRRVGELVPQTKLPGYEFYFSSTSDIFDANRQPLTRDEIRGRLEPYRLTMPDVKFGVTRGQESRIYLQTPNSERMEECRAIVNNVLADERFTWVAEDLKCENFLMHATRVVYDSTRRDGYVDLLVAASEEEIKSDVSSHFDRLRLAALFFTFIAVLLAFGLSSAITKPLHRVIASTQRLAHGNAALDLPVNNRGEIGTLARYFQRMANLIAERNQALADREARMRAIVGSAAEGILTIDREGHIQTANDAAEQLFSVSSQGLLGRPLQEFINSPAGRESSNLPPLGTVETTAHARDGRIFPVEISIAPVAFDSESNFNEPAASQRPAALAPPQPATVGMQPATAGVEPAKAGVQPAPSTADSKPPQRNSTLFVAIVRDITARKRSESEIQLLNADLQRFNLQLDERVRRRTADLERVLADVEVARDEAIRADRAKSAFLANMSHELRTPLNAIIGYAELLIEEAEDSGDSATIDDLKKIIDAGRHLLTLINDVLDLSKIEAERLSLHDECINVRQLLESVRETVQPLASRNSNQFLIEQAANAAELQADVTRVRQLLLNLLSNAFKFTNQGTVSLTVSRVAGSPGETLEFAVRDTGIGITDEQLRRLFQPFSQADTSTTKRFGGTGLGLAICKRLAELMGGGIRAESVAGEGSTFTVFLPVQRQEVPHEVPAVEPVAYVLPSANPASLPADAPLVLVIDDDPAVRDLMGRQLNREGLRVVTAASGKEGIELARTMQPAFITLDVIMPGTDGWAVLSDLKGDPSTRDLPVIMLTMVDDRDLGFTLGASDFMMKPIDRERLLQIVAKYRPAPGRPILIAEDDLAARELLQRTLTGAGYPVVEAVNGRDALELLDKTAPALVLLDLMMPVMDGFDFLDEIRHPPRSSTVPVIVVTAKELTASDRERLNGRVRRILQKASCGRDQLLREVRQLVGRMDETGRYVYDGSETTFISQWSELAAAHLPSNPLHPDKVPGGNRSLADPTENRTKPNDDNSVS